MVVTGAGLGLPGGENVFGDDKVPSILRGDQLIDTIPVKQRKLMADKKITRLVKSEAGGGHFETIDSQADVIKLAGRSGKIEESHRIPRLTCIAEPKKSVSLPTACIAMCMPPPITPAALASAAPSTM